MSLVVLVVFLYGTLVLAEQRSGHVIMLQRLEQIFDLVAEDSWRQFMRVNAKSPTICAHLP